MVKLANITSYYSRVLEDAHVDEYLIAVADASIKLVVLCDEYF